MIKWDWEMKKKDREMENKHGEMKRNQEEMTGWDWEMIVRYAAMAVDEEEIVIKDEAIVKPLRENRMRFDSLTLRSKIF